MNFPQTMQKMDQKQSRLCMAHRRPKDRITRRRTKHGRGVLEDLLECPIEIQLEVSMSPCFGESKISSQACQVFRHMELRDLFNLSLTCKTFRNFLWSSNNKSLWDYGLKNEPDLPERPPFPTLPAFVHLLAAPCCHVSF